MPRVGALPLVEWGQREEPGSIPQHPVCAARPEEGPVAAVVEDDENADEKPGRHDPQRRRDPRMPAANGDDHGQAERQIGNEGLEDLEHRTARSRPGERLNRRIELSSGGHLLHCTQDGAATLFNWGHQPGELSIAAVPGGRIDGPAANPLPTPGGRMLVCRIA
jgi:hypothetical protein